MLTVYKKKQYAGLLLAGILFVTAVVQVVDALSIYAKAELAQVLLQDAWQDTLAGGKQVRPWPWADTWPVARLEVPRLAQDMIILAGADGASLPFGPGHVTSTAMPGATGVSVISAHRDTHFAFLQEIQISDQVVITDNSGRRHTFEVVDTGIVDAGQVALANSAAHSLVVLTTCFPFDAILPGGPLRYVVTLASR